MKLTKEQKEMISKEWKKITEHTPETDKWIQTTCVFKGVK